MKRISKFRDQLLARAEPPPVIVGVHNALTAHLTQRAGFEGGWLSSLEVSAINGLPDRSVLGFTEMLALARSVVSSCDLPIVVDADSGYGTRDTMARAAFEFSSAGLAGMCVEDNAFPKRNSLIEDDDERELEDPDEFATRIAIACDARADSDFLIIARTEALIAGHSIHEAIARARRYVDAGADLTLVHSRAPSGAEAVEVARRWDHSAPLMSIPTAFPHFDVARLDALGYRLVVYANHLLRSAIRSMGDTLSQMRSRVDLEQVEKNMISVRELIELGEGLVRRSTPSHSDRHDRCR